LSHTITGLAYLVEQLTGGTTVVLSKKDTISQIRPMILKAYQLVTKPNRERSYQPFSF